MSGALAHDTTEEGVVAMLFPFEAAASYGLSAPNILPKLTYRKTLIN